MGHLQSVQRALDELQANENLLADFSPVVKNLTDTIMVVASGVLKGNHVDRMENSFVNLRVRTTFSVDRVSPKGSDPNVTIACPMIDPEVDLHREVCHAIGRIESRIKEPKHFANLTKTANCDKNSLSSPTITDSLPPNVNAGHFVCSKSFGIKKSSSVLLNNSVISLGDGVDVAYGLTKGANQFYFTNGQKYLTGGDRDDVFYVNANKATGILKGKLGRNTIVLRTVDRRCVVVNGHCVNFVDHYYHEDDDADAECHLFHHKITNLVGQSNVTDHVRCWCNLSYVDTEGGPSQNHPDVIIVPNYTCSYQDLKIKVGKNTWVNNRASSGRFLYNIDRSEVDGMIKLNLHATTGSVDHTIDFLYSIDDVTSFKVTGKNHKSHVKHVEIVLNNTLRVSVATEDKLNHVKFTFDNETTFHLQSGHPVVTLKSTQSVEQLMDVYRALVDKLNVSMVAFSHGTNTSLLLSPNGPKVDEKRLKIKIVQSHASHRKFFLDDGLNVVQIVGNSSAESLAKLKVPRRTTLTIRSRNQKTIIYVKNLIVTLDSMPEKYELRLHMRPWECSAEPVRSILVQLLAFKNGTLFSSFGNIMIQSDLDNFYENIYIVSYSTSTLKSLPECKINSSTKMISLVPVPLNINQNLTFVTLKPHQVEQNQHVHLSRPLGAFNMARANDSLILTNMLDTLFNGDGRMMTVVLEDFFAARGSRMRTLRFCAPDLRIIYMENVAGIDRRTIPTVQHLFGRINALIEYVDVVYDI